MEKKPDDTNYEGVSITAVTRENVKIQLDILKLSRRYILFLELLPELALKH